MKVELGKFKKSIVRLKSSYNMCEHIKLNKPFSENDFDAYESLTSRFSRAIDLFTQRILRIIFNILGEAPETFLDAANLAEKLDLVNSNLLLKIRRQRNKIAHEYDEDKIYDIFKSTLEYTLVLFHINDELKNYIKKKGWVLLYIYLHLINILRIGYVNFLNNSLAPFKVLRLNKYSKPLLVYE